MESPGLTRLRAHTQAEAIRQDTLALQERARAAVVTPPQPKAKPTGRAKRYPRPDHAKIVVLVPDAPKRGRALLRFRSYASCKTVRNYLAAWGEKQADRDLAYDIRKGFIRVV